MAAEKTPGGQIDSTPGPMTFYGVNSILGTGRGKTAAGRQNGREKNPVTLDQGKAEQ